MNWAPLALVIVLAFAGGWVWRGAFDLWRNPKAKVYGETNMVWGTTATSSGADITVTEATSSPAHLSMTPATSRPPPPTAAANSSS